MSGEFGAQNPVVPRIPRNEDGNLEGTGRSTKDNQQWIIAVGRVGRWWSRGAALRRKGKPAVTYCGVISIDEHPRTFAFVAHGCPVWCLFATEANEELVQHAPDV